MAFCPRDAGKGVIDYLLMRAEFIEQEEYLGFQFKVVVPDIISLPGHGINDTRIFQLVVSPHYGVPGNIKINEQFVDRWQLVPPFSLSPFQLPIKPNRRFVYTSVLWNVL